MIFHFAISQRHISEFYNLIFMHHFLINVNRLLSESSIMTESNPAKLSNASSEYTLLVTSKIYWIYWIIVNEKPWIPLLALSLLSLMTSSMKDCCLNRRDVYPGHWMLLILHTNPAHWKDPVHLLVNHLSMLSHSRSIDRGNQYYFPISSNLQVS